jgi:CHRD domain
MRLGGEGAARVAIALALIFGVTGAVAESSRPGPRAPSFDSSSPAGCRTDPHIGVHDPQRLKILNPCATFVGTVVQAPELSRGDGDVSFDVKPDSGYEWMLNAHNRSSDHGLHAEIVPMDQPGCTPGQPIARKGINNLGVCSGANVLFPPLGAHVRLTGAYVFDTWAGPNELHPIWRAEVLSGGPPSPTLTIRLKAHLTGRAFRGSGRLALTMTAGNVCWRFRGLAHLARPKRATIRAGSAHQRGSVALTLGSRYRTQGCIMVDQERLQSLAANPHAYYVAVATERHPNGAVRGQLTRVAD